MGRVCSLLRGGVWSPKKTSSKRVALVEKRRARALWNVSAHLRTGIVSKWHWMSVGLLPGSKADHRKARFVAKRVRRRAAGKGERRGIRLFPLWGTRLALLFRMPRYRNARVPDMRALQNPGVSSLHRGRFDRVPRLWGNRCRVRRRGMSSLLRKGRGVV